MAGGEARASPYRTACRRAVGCWRRLVYVCANGGGQRVGDVLEHSVGVEGVAVLDGGGEAHIDDGALALTRLDRPISAGWWGRDICQDRLQME
jgi:hypothetical protein